MIIIMCVTVSGVQKLVDSLSNGKVCGLDRLNAEHLKFAGPRLAVLLSLCFFCYACPQSSAL